MTDWQSVAALIVVGLTLLAFFVRMRRNRGRKNRGCHECGSGNERETKGSRKK